jgi:branched-chain amino acid aminotransferase
MDGALVDEADARVSPVDHGVLVGDGVFETLKVVGGEPFALTRHLRRLRRSAAALGLGMPVDDDALRAGAEAVIAANQPGVGRLRITLTGGPGPLGSARGDAGPTLLLSCGPTATWEPVTDVVTVPWPRNERGALAGVKSTSYAENVVALATARAAGASEALFANTVGDLCEGTGTNVFVGIGDRLLTPPLSSGCLAGITRELVIELVDVVEEDLPLAALTRADEVFLTSSTRDVQPVGAVDGRPLPQAPGPLTAAARAAFADLEARDLDP